VQSAITINKLLNVHVHRRSYDTEMSILYDGVKLYNLVVCSHIFRVLILGAVKNYSNILTFNC